mmetsp:Transcript_1868/g.1666  ORF Transcript_1868/g.1666 Transcript_1868/m.1666 type:complete len:147 (+) Transcript_1868:307-747(+)
MEDYNEFEEILGEKDKTVDKLNEGNKSRGDMKTGMGEVKEKLQEDSDEEEKKYSKGNEPKEDNKSHLESKHEFGKDNDDPEAEDKNKVKDDPYGDDVKNDNDTPQFVGTLGSQAYVDFQEFCKILSVFNPRFNIDEKVKFYFKIFD